jgi:energy-coupling factor transport system permease protein
MKDNILTKLSALLFLWVCAFLLPWYVSVSLMATLVVLRLIRVIEPVNERLRSAFDRYALYLLLLFMALIVVNAVFIHGGASFALFGLVTLHEAGAMFGLATASRLGLLATATLLFFVSTPLRELVTFLQTAGLPPTIASMILLSLHFVQTIPAKIDRVYLAQEARGAPVRGTLVARIRSFGTLLTPLVLSAIVESLQRGMALELRGALWSPTKPVRRWRFSAPALVFIFLAVAVVVLKVLQWLTP